MDRREFLRRGGAALLGASLLPLVSDCTSRAPARSVSSSLPAPSRPPVPPDATPSPQADWQSLGESLDGTLYRPGSPGYRLAAQLFDPRFDGAHPVAVARCASVSDVQRAIVFAREHDIAICARSGGHSYGGYSTGPGIVVDVSGMSSVGVTTSHARVGAGARLVDIYARVGHANRALPGGTCPTVGIAGLTLGGGQGVVGRKLGLTCDSVESLQIVTADGVVRRCSEQEDADLFWANRGGGGGNFGVVTSFTFRTSPIGDVVAFTLDWPWAAAADVVDAWQRWGPEAPDELWSDCHLVYRETSGPSVSVNGMFVGPTSGLTGDLARLGRLVGVSPSYSVATPMSYLDAMMLEAGCAGKTQAQCHLTSQDPAGTLARESSLATSDFYDQAVPSAGIEAMLHAVEARGAEGALRRGDGGILLDAFGGAINRVPADATAFVHRSSSFLAQSFVTLPPGASASLVARNQRWLEVFWSTMRPWASGAAYQNYIDPHLKDWQQAYYGTNLARLVEIKRSYDPDDVFHFAQSIPTRSP